MRIDTAEIAGINGFEVPDGTQVDSEFTLQLKVRVFALERDLIDVRGFGDTAPRVANGALRAKLIALDVRDG